MGEQSGEKKYRGHLTVLTLPVAISACSSVSSTQKLDQLNQAEALVKKCIVEKSSKDLKIKFVKTEKTQQFVLSPAQKENGISEQAVMDLDYISSLNSKSWTDHTLRVLLSNKSRKSRAYVLR